MLKRVFFALLAATISFGAAAQVNESTTRYATLLLNKKEYKEALPYYQQILASGDVSTKFLATVELLEHWLQYGTMGLSRVADDYMVLIQKQANERIANPNKQPSDHYIIGMYQYALAFSGMQKAYPAALTYLYNAANGHYPKAATFYAACLDEYRKLDPSVKWTDVLDAYTFASSEAKDYKPLLDLAHRYIHEGTAWYKPKSVAEQDTAIYHGYMALDALEQLLPDSFYMATIILWGSSVLNDKKPAPDEMRQAVFGYFQKYPPTNTPGSAKARLIHNFMNYVYFNDKDSKKLLKSTSAKTDAQLREAIIAFTKTLMQWDLGDDMTSFVANNDLALRHTFKEIFWNEDSAKECARVVSDIIGLKAERNVLLDAFFPGWNR